MGREMSKIVKRNEKLFNRIKGILDANTTDANGSKIAGIMVEYFENTVEDSVILLEQLKRGFTEV